MKNLIKIIPLIAIMLVVQSCSDVLDNAGPSRSVQPEQALSTPGLIKGVRAGIFSQLQTPEFTTDYMLFPDALADNIHNRIGANRLSGVSENINFGGLLDDAGNGDGVDGYDIAYDIINRANLLINNIPEGVLSDGLESQYKGEAYFMRAFAYHQLVRSLAYEPGNTPGSGDGQGFELGTILRTTPTLQASDANYRPRATSAGVYEQIESDLDKATQMLGVQQSASRAFPQKAAAEALHARVSLYLRNYQDANSFAQDAMDDSDAELVTDQAGVASMFNENAGLNPEGIWILTIDPQTETVGGNTSLNVYTAERYIGGVPTQDLMDLYSNDDYRLAWFGACFDELAGEAKDGCLATHPNVGDGSPLELDKWNAEAGNFADDVPYLRVSEMLLIQAEARLKGADGDPLAPLNKLRAARGESDYAGADVMQAILNERRKEFIGEGQRFFDLKRLGRDIRKAPGTDETDVPYFDHRVLDNIPTDQVTTSEANAPQDSVLIQNPGY